MKKALFFLLMPLVSIAQITTYKVPVTQWGHQGNAVVYTPPEYKDSVDKYYPTILFFHGRGEGGTNLNTLYNQGVPKRIKSGWEPQAVNPITGVLEKFIVIAVQDPGGWSPYPETMKYAMQYLSPMYRIDTNRIYATGLSAGGQTSVMYATWDTADYKKVAAIISASPSGLEQRSYDNLTQLAANNVSVWFWSGNADGIFTENAIKYTGIINKAGGDAFMQTFSGGHCCWDDLFGGKVTRSWNGRQVNIYEWFLLHSKAIVEPPATVKYIQIFHDPAKVQKVIILDKDGTWTEHNDSSIVSGQIKLIVQ